MDEDEWICDSDGDRLPDMESEHYQPENICLRLPSLVLWERAEVERERQEPQADNIPDDPVADDVEELAATELRLRKGWANNMLRNVRLSVGEKSVLWSKGVRQAATKKHGTRTKTSIRKLEGNLEHQRRVYNQNRKTMIRLGLPLADQLGDYRELSKADVEASSVIGDPNARGASQNRLPWIWATSSQANTNRDGSELEECT